MRRFTELGFSTDTHLESILRNIKIHDYVPNIYDLYCVLLQSRTMGSHKKYRVPNIAKSKQGLINKITNRMYDNNMFLWNSTMQHKFARASKSHLPARLRNNKLFVNSFMVKAAKNSKSTIQYRKNGTLLFSFRAKTTQHVPSKFWADNYVSAEQTWLHNRRLGYPFSPRIKPQGAGFSTKHFFIARFDPPRTFSQFHGSTVPGGTIGVYKRVPGSTRRGDIFETTRVALDNNAILKIFQSLKSKFTMETQTLIQHAISGFFSIR